MTTLPTWLTRDTFVCHQPTKTVFQPTRCGRKDGVVVVLDPCGQDYKLEECDRLNVEHIRSGVALFIVDQHQALTLIPCEDGFIATSGDRRCKVEIPDMGLAAARSLAAAFNGVIYSEETRNGC